MEKRGYVEEFSVINFNVCFLTGEVASLFMLLSIKTVAYHPWNKLYRLLSMKAINMFFLNRTIDTAFCPRLCFCFGLLPTVVLQSVLTHWPQLFMIHLSSSPIHLGNGVWYWWQSDSLVVIPRAQTSGELFLLLTGRFLFRKRAVKFKGHSRK